MAFAKRLIALSAAAVMASGGAHAATVFTLNGANFGDFTETVDDITLDISSGDEGSLHFNGSGVGVNSGANDQSENRLGGDNEAIVFVFDPAVTILQSVAFETGGGVDTVSIFDGNDNFITSFDVANNNANNNGYVTVDLTDVTGSVFKFVSTANPRAPGKPDGGIRITSLTVEAVPVPAALPLMAAGIGGLSLMGRRRKRAHA